MTWRELFARLWFFLRAHLRRQHMCPECGDALIDKGDDVFGLPS